MKNNDPWSAHFQTVASNSSRSLSSCGEQRPYRKECTWHHPLARLPTGAHAAHTWRCQNALHSLLAEQGWDGINVQKLCERADVGRSTFYLHFQNKEELLASGLAGLRNLLREQASDRSPGSLFFVRLLIERIHEERKLFRAVIGGRKGHVVQTRFRELLVQLAEEDLSSVAAAGWCREAGARYLAGALAELLTWWVEAAGRQTPDEIEHLFQQLAAPAIELLGHPKG